MDPRKLTSFGRKQPESVAAAPEAPVGGVQSESMHRLQIGLSGLAAMVLLVGLANIIQDRARVSDAMAVPEAAPTTEPSAQAIQSDPLADAGLVPDMPVEPSASPSPTATGPKTDDVSDPRR